MGVPGWSSCRRNHGFGVQRMDAPALQRNQWNIDRVPCYGLFKLYPGRTFSACLRRHGGRILRACSRGLWHHPHPP